MLWTNKNATSLINKCCPELLATYDSYKHAIQKADAARSALSQLTHTAERLYSYMQMSTRSVSNDQQAEHP